MFRKLFLSFFLTVLIVAAALVVQALYLRRVEQQSRALSATIVDDARRGELRPPLVNVLDEHLHSIVGRPPSPAQTDAAMMAARVHVGGFGDTYGGRDGVVAIYFLGAKGRPFTAIAQSRANVVVTRVYSRYIALIAILAVGAIACFVVARSVSAPLVQLGAAANAVADGRLQTRVAPQLAARRDEIGRLARDFDRMTERIEALVAAERRTLGDASHELRSPLARLNVALSLARQHPEAREHLDRIEREAGRLDKLIAELLALARIDSGVDAARGPFDLGALLEEIVADGDFEARANGRRVELVVDDACVVHGSAELMRSAIENVVRNAIRHTREGTAVEVHLQRADDAATLTVRDHGNGVPEELLAEIFVPFRHGLGLAIAQRVVQMHGGTIRASNAAEGMLVTIALPLS
jgi:signal transduction histidine kinase